MCYILLVSKRLSHVYKGMNPVGFALGVLVALDTISHTHGLGSIQNSVATARGNYINSNYLVYNLLYCVMYSYVTRIMSAHNTEYDY